MRFILATLVMILITLNTTVSAGSPTEALSRCLVVRTNSEDQAMLQAWTLIGLSKNPGMREIIPLNDALDEKLTKAFAKLFERLIYEDCTQEFKDALKVLDQNPMGVSFKALGAETMKVLMNHPSQAEHIQSIFNYFDLDRYKAFVKKESANQ